MLSASFKIRLYRYKNGKIPANLYNVYQLLSKYEHEYGLYGKDRDGAIICIRAGIGCRIVGKKFGEVERTRMRVFVGGIFDSIPSHSTARRVIDMISDDYTVSK